MATIDTIRQYFADILQRSGSEVTSAEINSYVSAVDSGALTLAQVRVALIQSPEGQDVQDVVRLYQTVFGRVPDKKGLNDQVDTLRGPATESDLANSFANSPEFISRFGGNTVNTAFINAVYQQVLGRTPSAGEVNFYLESGFSAGRIALAFSESPEFQAATSTAVVGFLDAAGQGTAVYTGSLGGTVNVGTTFTLTTGIDVLTGTAQNDTFVASFDGAATSTSNLGDSINGGAGVDTLRLVSNAANTPVPTLTGVENLVLVDTVHEARDVSGIADLTSLTLEGGAASAVGAADTAITLAATQSLTLDGVKDAGGTTADVANQEGIDIASAASVTSLNLNLKNAGSAGNGDLDLDVTGSGVATLNVVSTGANFISLANAGGALTTVNLSGSGSTTILGTNPGTITTFDASKATGAVTANLSSSAGANQTITGGSGDDSFIVNLAQNITFNGGAGNDVVTLANPSAVNLSSTVGAADSIKGGAGTDTLALTAAGATALAGDAAADRAVISEFEQLRVVDNLNGSTFDISKFGLNYLQVDAATTVAATVNGFTSGATVEYRANGDSTAAVNIGVTDATKAATPNDVVNLVLNADITNQTTAPAAIEFAAGIAGVNKLNVSTADSNNADGASSRDDGYILNLSNDNTVDTITVTGSSELSFTSTASTAALQTVNASALTGDLIVNLATNGLTQGVVVTGGAGANSITGTGFADNITGGARADTINGGDGTDILTGGAGGDTFVFAAGSTGGTPSATNFDTITDFGKASDIIDLDGTAISITAGGNGLAGQASINAEGIASFNAADNTLALRLAAVASAIEATGGSVAGETAIFEFGSDSYVFTSDATPGLSATDNLVKLTGVTGLSDSTINGSGDLLIA